MSLPPRSFYALTDVAIRWSVTPFDVIGWSTDGAVGAFGRAAAGEDRAGGNPIGRDRHRSPAPVAALSKGWRVEPDDRDPSREDERRRFRWITEPADGAAITASDVLVRRAEVDRFERRYGFFNGLRLTHRDVGSASSNSRSAIEGEGCAARSNPLLWP
jgi:hypothetical protein